MKSELKKRSSLCSILILFLAFFSARADTIPAMFSRPPQWEIGATINPAWVPGTNRFLKGTNPQGERIDASFGADLRAGFRFNPATREGRLYPGLYQGIGIGMNSYFANSLLGTPVSVYVYQGAPIMHFTDRLSLDYEWQFGAAFGWKHYDSETADNNAVVSTSVTAHMGIGFKLRYSITPRLQMSLGVAAKHFSNGNTSWPNAGVNTVGATIGMAWLFGPDSSSPEQKNDSDIKPDLPRWCYDIMVFGAWRKRAVVVGIPPEPELCPGRFGVLGLQFAPLCRLNRWVAVGPALDFQWDESAALAPYWVSGSYDDNIKFRRPPFGKQISLGLSAHAELTMPIFSVNAGIGYDVVNPRGDRAFYQSLTLKTFITPSIYLNTGYRLGAFKDPQNLMLGIGLRL